MVVRIVVLGGALLFALLAGCSSSNACTPGRLESCPCAGGGTGIQECQANGTFGSCDCTAPDAPLPFDAGTEDDAPIAVDAPTDGTAPTDDVVAPDDVPSEPDAPVDVPGHVVLIGAYPLQVDESIDRIIANAVLLSERPGDVAVTEYVEHSTIGGWDVQARLHEIIEDRAEAESRTVTFTDLTSAFDLEDVIGTTDVLFVHGQFNAGTGWMAGVASAWHDDLVAFVDAGGVVVVLSINKGEHAVVSGDDLLNVPSANWGTAYGPSTTFTVVAPDDPLGEGVISPFPATEPSSVVCFMGSSGGMLVARETTMLCPIVRHLER